MPKTAIPKGAAASAAQDDPSDHAQTESATSEAQIYERVLAAIVQQQLPPGTRLREDEMSQIFGVSRSRIRSALSRLAFTGIVRLEPHRGASVTRPTVKEAREIFAARRMIESTIVREVAARFGPKEKLRLANHIKLEQAAEARRDRTEMIRLSGEFHLVLAEMSDNAVLHKFLAELITRESLVIATYETPGRPSCSNHEHQQILDALARGDANRAERLMLAHLENIEARLDLDRTSHPKIDLARILGGSPG